MTNGVMEDFQRSQYNLPALHEFVDVQSAVMMKAFPAMLREEARETAVRMYQDLEQAEVYINDQYQVSVDKNPEHGFPDTTIWHLSIKRLDKEPLHDWRDLQTIKNKLAGEDVEAIELYPVEKRVVDTANQYHLFCFIWNHTKKGKSRPLLPLGFKTGLRLDSEPGTKSKQRPLEPVQE